MGKFDLNSLNKNKKAGRGHLTAKPKTWTKLNESFTCLEENKTQKQL